MKDIFENKVIWIVGASSGIGEALAVYFNQLGSKIILSARREEELLRIKNSTLFPENNKILPLDLFDSSDFNEKTKEAFSFYNTVDYVFLNGGTSSRGSVAETNIEVYKKMMDLNFFSYVELTKEILPYFNKQKHGHFIVTSSTMGKIGSLGRSAYASSKHALHGFYDCLRAEVTPQNIYVTLLTPGYIATNISYNSLMPDGSPRKEMSENIKNGLPVAKAAQQIAKGVKKKKNEIFIGKKLGVEHLSLFLMRFFPGILHKAVRAFPPK